MFVYISIIKNKYIGGVIAPGVALSLNNLISKASLIPNIKLSFIKKIIGTNTSTAVKSGFFHGYSGLLNSIIHQIHLETKKKFRIILTGGFSHLFKKSIKYKNTIKKEKGMIFNKNDYQKLANDIFIYFKDYTQKFGSQLFHGKDDTSYPILQFVYNVCDYVDPYNDDGDLEDAPDVDDMIMDGI